MTQMNKYRKDKLAFANERAEVYLKQLSEDLPVEKIKAILLQSIKEKVDHFFSDVLLKKLSSIKALITNIENDLRESATIRATSQKVEGLLRPIYGRVLASEIDVFGENCIKTSDFSDVKEKGDMIFVSFNFKNTTKHSVLKKVTFSGREDGWKYLAGIHAFRRLHHHNLLQIYGVCVPQGCEINEKLFILHEEHDKDLAYHTIQRKAPWTELTQYLLDTLEGLSYLHINGLVHRNIRLETIVIKEGQGKLTEIGDRNCGEIPAIRAPESLESDLYGYESDIFQFGMITWECYHNERVFNDSQTFQEVSARIRKGERPIIKLPCPDGIKDCLQSCWQENPSERPSAKQIKSLIDGSFEA